MGEEAGEAEGLAAAEVVVEVLEEGLAFLYAVGFGVGDIVLIED